MKRLQKEPVIVALVILQVRRVLSEGQELLINSRSRLACDMS